MTLGILNFWPTFFGISSVLGSLFSPDGGGGGAEGPVVNIRGRKATGSLTARVTTRRSMIMER